MQGIPTQRNTFMTTLSGPQRNTCLDLSEWQKLEVWLTCSVSEDVKMGTPRRRWGQHSASGEHGGTSRQNDKSTTFLGGQSHL